MHLKLEQENGNRTAYFGISDFRIAGDNQIEIAFHSDVNLEPDEKYRSEEGTIVCAVSESGYNTEGAYETIGDLSIEEGTNVVVGVSNNYPHIATAARRLTKEPEFEGDLQVIEPSTA